jgi:uncharacterized protein (TIGR03083 family)
MLDLETGRKVILRELDGIITRLDEASQADWSRPVRCEGWTILDLAVHCTSAPRAAAEAFRRMQAGVSEAPAAPVPPERERSAVMRTLLAGRRELATALAALSPDSLERLFPLFFVSLPGAFGLQLIAFEIGMHRNDLEWALGNETRLPREVTDAGGTLAPAVIPRLGAGAPEKPERPIFYRFESPERVLELSFTDGEWRTSTDPSVPTCVIEGDDSSIALFVFGRIPADHPSLRVSGERALARRFKAYFPGPVNEVADGTTVSSVRSAAPR